MEDMNEDLKKQQAKLAKKESNRKYYLKNKSKHLENMKKYKEEHSDAIKAYHRNYYLAHKTIIE